MKFCWLVKNLAPISLQKTFKLPQAVFSNPSSIWIIFSSPTPPKNVKIEFFHQNSLLPHSSNIALGVFCAVMLFVACRIGRVMLPCTHANRMFLPFAPHTPQNDCGEDGGCPPIDIQSRSRGKLKSSLVIRVCGGWGGPSETVFSSQIWFMALDDGPIDLSVGLTCTPDWCWLIGSRKMGNVRVFCSILPWGRWEKARKRWKSSKNAKTWEGETLKGQK